jgi:hypothetical protein
MNTLDTPISVEGSVQTADGRTLLILASRLEGHDTFLTGTLDLGAEQITVRVMTFDDMTVLLPDHDASPPSTSAWTGALRLRRGRRQERVPADLAAAASEQGILLSALDEPEMRYATTYLDEATTPQIRQARIAAILGPLPQLPGARS